MIFYVDAHNKKYTNTNRGISSHKPSQPFAPSDVEENDRPSEVQVEFQTFAETHVSRQTSPDSRAQIWKKRALLHALWLPTACILSIPMGMSMLCLSIPPTENVMGFTESTIRTLTYTMGATLYLIKSYPLPMLARRLTRCVYGNADDSNVVGRIMMLGTFILAVMVPAIMVIYTNEDCFAGWKQLWSPCQVPGLFDTFVSHLPTGILHDDVDGILVDTNTTVSIDILQHDDICKTSYTADGRCPRALISSLGDLYTKDLCFSLSVGPVLSFVRATPFMQRVKQWVVRKCFNRPEYQPRSSADRFINSAVLLLELPIVLGFCYPILPILACLAMVFTTGVFHLAVNHLDVEFKPHAASEMPVTYLYSSLILGCAIPIWLYLEADLHGKWFIVIGMPLSSIVCTLALQRLPKEQGDAEERFEGEEGDYILWEDEVPSRHHI